MISFKTFITEAIPLSVSKQKMKELGDFNYKELYKDWFGTTERGKPIYRVVLPLTSKSAEYAKVEEVLQSYGFTITDWQNGQCASEKTPNNPRRIGSILQDRGETDALKAFNERNKGKSSSSESEKLVVISRHPYDIMGQSFDRAWTSCKNLKDGANKHYIPVEIKEGCLVAYVVENNKIVNKHETVSLNANSSYEEIKHTFDLIKNNKGHWIFDDFYQYDFSQFYNILKNEIYNKNVKFMELFNKRINSALGLKNSKDILSDPTCRYLIIPYINENDPKDVYLVVSEKVYGKQVDGFKETVQNWLDKHQGKKEGLYCLHKDVYPDNSKLKLHKYEKLKPGTITKLSGKYKNYTIKIVKVYTDNKKEYVEYEYKKEGVYDDFKKSSEPMELEKFIKIFGKYL